MDFGPENLISRRCRITDEEEAPEGTMTEICCAPSSSNTPTTPTERPFKLLVKNQVFVIDAEKFGKLSPVFNFMCFGKDFDNRELIREVVDEKAENISEFLQCIHNHAKINGMSSSLKSKYLMFFRMELSNTFAPFKQVPSKLIVAGVRRLCSQIKFGVSF